MEEQIAETEKGGLALGRHGKPGLGIHLPRVCTNPGFAPPPEMQPKPENSESKELVDVPEEEGSVDAPEEVSADAPEEEGSADAPEEEGSADAPEEEGSFDPYSTYVHIAGDLE